MVGMQRCEAPTTIMHARHFGSTSAFSRLTNMEVELPADDEGLTQAEIQGRQRLQLPSAGCCRRQCTDETTHHGEFKRRLTAWQDAWKAASNEKKNLMLFTLLRDQKKAWRCFWGVCGGWGWWEWVLVVAVSGWWCKCMPC